MADAEPCVFSVNLSFENSKSCVLPVRLLLEGGWVGQLGWPGWWVFCVI